MTRQDVTIEGSTGDAVRATVRDLGLMLDAKVVNLTQLGKLYERIARNLLDAVEQSGLSSLRFRAAAKALDLKTQKSSLAAFLQESNAPADDAPTGKEEP